MGYFQIKPIYSFIFILFIPFYIGVYGDFTRPNVAFQAHSYNDLDEIQQVTKKLARDFKVDPHYVKSEDCELNGIEDERGCLLLNHDDPDSP